MGNRKFNQYSLSELIKRKSIIEKGLSSYLDDLIKLVNNASEPIIEGHNDKGYSIISNNYVRQLNFASSINDFLPDSNKININNYNNKYTKVIDRMDDLNRDYLFRKKEEIRSNLSKGELKRRMVISEEEFNIPILKDPTF